MLRRVRRRAQSIANGLAAAVERLISPATVPSPTTHRSELGVVFLQWDPNRSRLAVEDLHETLERLERWIPRFVVVDNRMSAERPARHGSRMHVVAGDNSAREFSGYAAGMAELRGQGAVPELWVLANDRFRSYAYPYVERISDGTLDVILEARAVTGKIDEYPQAIDSFGSTVHRWIKTAFYVVPDAVFSVVGGPVLVDDSRFDEIVPRLLPPDGGAAALPSPPFDEQHVAYLLDFLTGEVGTDYGARWYQAFALDEESWPLFRSKVMSILNEQLFSALAVQAGFPILDLRVAVRIGALGVQHPVSRRVLAEIEQDPGEGSIRHLAPSQRVRTALSTWMSH